MHDRTLFHDQITESILPFFLQKKGGTLEDYIAYSEAQVMEFTSEEEKRVLDALDWLRDKLEEGEPFAEYEAAARDPEQSRIITVVFDPDTENERGVEYVLPRNAGFNIFLNGEYVKQPYTDRECTQPFEGSDGVEDLVLYVK